MNNENEHSQIYSLERSQRLFAEAKIDLESAKNDYDAHTYARIPFLLEQAIELGIKSIEVCLYSMNITNVPEEKIIKFGHQSTKVYQSIFFSTSDNLDGFINNDSDLTLIFKMMLDKIGVTLEEYNKCRDPKSEYWAIIDKIRKNIDIPADDFEKIVNQISKVNAEFISARENRKEILTDDFLKGLIAAYVEDYIDSNRGLKRNATPEYRQYVNKILFKCINKDALSLYVIGILNLMQSDYIVSCLSVITEKHATSRYPEGDFIPAEFYTLDRPIINKFPVIYQLACDAFSSWDSFIKKDIGIISNPFFCIMPNGIE
jgi:hypothetical protein